MIRLQRTDSGNTDFTDLVRKLDAYLAEIDGEEHAFYAQFNKTDHLKQVVVAYMNEVPVGCGAIRPFEGAMEVKRMYTEPDHRGRGIAKAVLEELEQWSKELGYQKTLLETGILQESAIRLYSQSGYQRMPNYGQYEGVDNSVCFQKILI